MRVFLTGGTGFIGQRVARRLRERGDDVVVLARSAQKASPLQALGCEVVEGDLSRGDAIAEGLRGADAAIHAAADYRVGVPARECAALHEANVRGTERVLDEAIDAGVARIVYVSTGNVFGNTGEHVADEGYERDTSRGFLSCYDETKYLAHQAARERIAQGAPIVIVQPGAVYGPGDESQVANIIDQTRTGKMKLLMFPDFTLSYVYVDDLADGIVKALDQGAIGESYVLGGEHASMKELVTQVAELSGRKPPTRALPSAAMKAGIPFGPVVGKLMGFPPNLRELISTSDGVKIKMTDAKARAELGYTTRPLRDGLRETLAATG
jgi:nucleoside-diphosphate-sugar epimerase